MDIKMGKFMKGCAITALILIVIGFVLGTVAGSVRGRTTFREVVESATRGRVRLDFFDIADTAGEWSDSILDDMDYSIESGTDFNYRYDIMSGNIERYCLGSDVKRLDIEAGACSLTTASSPDGSFYLEVENADKFQGYLEDGTLYIRSAVSTRGVHGWHFNVITEGSRITLYMPENYHFESADIDIGAGALKMRQLSADEIELEAGAGKMTLDEVWSDELSASVGAGEIEMGEITVNDLDVEVGMGGLSAAGSINSRAGIECSMGNVGLKLNGMQEDFNYDLSSAMGNLTLGNHSRGGFANGQYINNNAQKEITVECSMGNVSILFED